MRKMSRPKGFRITILSMNLTFKCFQSKYTSYRFFFNESNIKVENNKWLICWEKGQWLRLNDKKQHKDQFILADLLLYFGFPSMLSKLIKENNILIDWKKAKLHFLNKILCCSNQY